MKFFSNRTEMTLYALAGYIEAHGSSNIIACEWMLLDYLEDPDDPEIEDFILRAWQLVQEGKEKHILDVLDELLG